MNKSFTIPELVVEICLQCDKQTLTTLGRTAHLFDCALDALWSGFHDEAYRIPISALIQCLPSEIWTRPKDGRFSFSSAIEPQHWNRFNFYARRIKALHLDTSVMDPAFLASLVGYKTLGHILPNLKDLLLSAHYENELLHAHEFLSPNLQILVLEILLEESIAGSILASLFHTVPIISENISNLELRISCTGYFPALHTLLGHLCRLRQLSLHFISAEHLPLIASLPELTHLSIYHIADSNVVLPSVPKCKCDTLVFLHISGSPNHIRVLFQLLSKCPLECISVRTLDVRDASEFAEIARVVTDKCQPYSLRRIKIATELAGGFAIAGEHLVPFLAFPNITRFEHDHKGPFHLDDSFISSLATSWPDLAHLDLCLFSRFYSANHMFATGQLYTTGVTALSFALLAFHCPRLTFIGLEFDATITTPAMLKRVGDYIDDKEGSFATQGVCNRSVHRLSVGYSPIAEPAPVSEFIHSIFPNITELDIYPPCFMGPAAREMYVERWRSVKIGLELETSS